MIHSSLRMKFTPEKLPEAIEILRSMVERTRVSEGCLGCDVYEHLLEPGVLLFEEWWNNHADLGRHLRSDLYRRVMLVIEMAMEYPVVKFSEIAHTTGLEIIEKWRRGLLPTEL
ncbi:MAG: putative quinol monooxygenase [Syntrophobacteraceae bacterium]